MQLLKALPRQPFIGIATAAGTGILWADFAPNALPSVAVVLGILALIALLWRRSLAVYALVVIGFFIVHHLRTSDSPGRRLAAEGCPARAHRALSRERVGSQPCWRQSDFSGGTKITHLDSSRPLAESCRFARRDRVD